MGTPTWRRTWSAITAQPPMPARRQHLVANMADLETPDAKDEGNQGIPVLVRQYLSLNATVLGFSVDPAFGNALDALMMVILNRLPARMERRYLGVASLRAAA